MAIPHSPRRVASPASIRLGDSDVGAVPDGATDGVLVSLAEAKRFINIDHDGDDALITSLIHAGESCAEGYLNRDLRARSYQAVYRCDDSVVRQFFTTGRPAHAVGSVEMWTAAGVLTTLDGDGDDAEYAVRAGFGGEKVVVLDTDVVSVYGAGSEDGDLALVGFSTADASSATLVGYHAIKRAVLHMVAGGYETREETVQGSGASFADNPAVERLMRPYRHHAVAVGLEA